MLAVQRRDAIAQRIRAEGRVLVTELAAELAITQETVRRDLDALEEAGIARRVHGGAVSAERVSLVESAVDDRVARNASGKRRIADLAATRLVALGATSVLVDAGTTTAAFAEALVQRWPQHVGARLVVATHAPAVAAILSRHPAIEVHVIGGRLRQLTGAAVGAQTLLAIQAMTPDVVVLGTNGLDADGLTTPDPEEAAVKAAIVAAGRRVACLADGSKVGASTLCRFAVLGDLDVVVTDAQPDPSLANALGAAGAEVHVA
ncbi:DeoR/GlpR family DNA-binding transcription regulator [Agrococcus sp. SGAir0287]|uniref:DeoR/GlpR family DNA-binding transcription regulator n=1 Tax=Agrococcus sp. SGAir0287 TaxID=2070347 RepID=UPI0010CD6A64|nr:DeoR/GlpR family DNA-binding transcription regulator [Agrococcus sp. SGAir0287]QCR19392.1 D-beta-D-heptose 1-phosphate adenosyltransferase [Agrococcus sp. SGAir0287]